MMEQNIPEPDGRQGPSNRQQSNERFFRSFEYECIYINEFEDPRTLSTGLAHDVQFYNEERPHRCEARPIQCRSHRIKPIAS